MSECMIHNVQTFIWNFDFYWLFLRIIKGARALTWGLSVWSSQPLIHSLKPFDLLQIASSIIYTELPTYFGKLYRFSPVLCTPTRCFKIQNSSCFYDYWLLPRFSETSLSAWSTWGSVETSFWRTGGNLAIEMNNNKNLLRMVLCISFLQFSRFRTSLYVFYSWGCLGSYVSILSCSHMYKHRC